MTPRVHVYTICRDEARMMPFWIRHYSAFCEKLIVYDGQSDDGTRAIVQACPKAELREWPYMGLDDEKFLQAVNLSRDMEGPAEWRIWADVDELLYHPDMLSMLGVVRLDLLGAIGYALISPNGFPKDDGRQLYEQVPTGIPQANYDKFILHRFWLPVKHAIGRHTYGKEWPQTLGRRGAIPGLKLFHCHHVGGVEHTKEINARNYERAVDKRYAWNYRPEHDKPEQAGSVAWVRDAIENGKLKEVWP